MFAINISLSVSLDASGCSTEDMQYLPFFPLARVDRVAREVSASSSFPGFRHHHHLFRYLLQLQLFFVITDNTISSLSVGEVEICV